HGHSLAASLHSIAAEDPATGSTGRASRDAQGESDDARDVTRESSYVESSRGAYAPRRALAMERRTAPTRRSCPSAGTPPSSLDLRARGLAAPVDRLRAFCIVRLIGRGAGCQDLRDERDQLLRRAEAMGGTGREVRDPAGEQLRR